MAARSHGSVLARIGASSACLVAILTILLPAVARAEGSPAITLKTGGATSVLIGAKATVSLEATNPEGQPYGYNLSYRAVLPAGVSYVAASAKTGSGGPAPTPTIIAEKPGTGETTLTFSNVSDLSPSSHNTLSFQVTSSASAYPVGSSYEISTGSYIASNPRYLPKFNSAGEPVGPSPTSFTGSATATAKRSISALEITQSEESPEGEILRGVHDHQTVYKITVTNNSLNPTSEVTVDDWLPAALEYLGCGGASSDHTTNAPTNPGSKEEYPGSGPINVSTLAGCTAPASVETTNTDPEGTGPIRTRLHWSVGELKAGETRTYEFRAAVPLRENTATWTGKEPTPASGEQAANLDNNSGKETRNGETLLTLAKTEGKYNGSTAVSAESQLQRTAKDLTTEKSASTRVLADGQLTRWTIYVHSSEYRYNTALTVTDTLPSGLCPLSSTNLTSSPECEPNSELPSSPYASAGEEANGKWKLVWNSSTDPALAKLDQNATSSISFSSRTRTHYQENHKAAGPILANDSVTNQVNVAGTTNVVCGGDSDCSAGGSTTPINHERPLSEPIEDTSAFSQSAIGPTIEKAIAQSGSECLTDTYTTTPPVYHPGDFICWRLLASFPTTLSTHGTEVSDFLPISTIFDEAFDAGAGEARTSNDTLPATTFEHANAGHGEPGGQIGWTLPESGYVGSGSQRFERVFASTATLPTSASPGELQGNLMKFANVNTGGESFSQRAEADFKLQFPQLSIAKQIVSLEGKAIAPTSTATVRGSSEAEFALTVSNAGEQEAERTEVRDLLPTGLTCAAVSSISNGGSCSEGIIRFGETGLGQPAIAVPASGQTALHFTVTVPATIDPATVLKDRAGVREYQSATNIGGVFTYIPRENIDPMLGEEVANAKPASAEAALQTEEVATKKTHSSPVAEPGNNSAQATIGEVVTFEVSATIPARTTLSGVAEISDPGLSLGRLIYEKGTVEALVGGAPAPGGFSAEEPSGKPIVKLPENYAAGASPVTVTMRFKASVTNVEANNAAGAEPAKAIPNTGKLAWTNPITGAQTREPTDSVPLVEPSITLTQSSSATKVHGGQLVEYKLKLTNASGASIAYNNKVVDTVPTGITPTNSKGEALKNGEATASGGIWNETARTITWEVAKVEGGKTQELPFYATVVESPVSATSYKNTALATTTSLASEGPTPMRTAANAPSTSIKAHYESKTEASLEIEGPTIAKEANGTTATIGHRIKYTLAVTLPAHVIAYDQTVLDVLPSSLDFDEYVSAECTSGCPPETAPTVLTYKPSTPSTTTTIGWYLGNLESTSVARTIKLVFYASVRPTLRSSSTKIEAGASIANSATVSYNQSHEVSFEEEKIPSKFKKSSTSNTVTTKVVEPKLSLEKEISLDGGKTYSAGPVTLTDGTSIAYRLKITNTKTNAGPAYGAVVTDKPPAGLEAITPTTNSAYVTKNAEGEIAWSIPGPIAEGATVELGYTAKLAPVKGLRPGQVVNNEAKIPTYYGVPEAERAEKLKNYFNEAIAYREYAGPTSKVQATVALPTITLEKLVGASGSATKANAEVGQPFTWRVIVKNTSSVPAKNLRVNDHLPANWEYVAKSASFSVGGKVEPEQSGSLEAGKELTWATSIELAAGQSTTLTYEARPTLAAATNPGSGEAHPNINTASAAVKDAAGNSEDAEGPFAAGPGSAEGILVLPSFEVSKTPTAAKVPAGATDAYTVRIHNAGAGTAREVKAIDTFPAGMTYTPGSATSSPKEGFSELSASSSSATWQIATIAAGATVEINVPVGTEAALASGTKLVNEVAVHSIEAPTPVNAKGTIETTTSADLAAFKEIVGKGPYIPGDTVVYKLGASNNGPSVARAVTLSDKLPNGETFVKLLSKSGPSSECNSTSASFTCEAAELAPGAKLTYEIEVKLASNVKSPIANAVLVKSATPDPEEKNNKAEATITPEPQADLALKKEALVSTVVLGETVGFRLTVTNRGPSDAEKLQVVDHLPAGLTYKSVSGAEATCATAGAENREVKCTLPKTLVAGEEAVLTITVQATALGTQSNTATVSSQTNDPEPTNNTDEAGVLVVSAPGLTKEAASSTATVGQRIAYTLTLTLPAHLTTYDHTVIDTLPNTLDFDEYTSAQCTAGCTPATTPTIHTYKPALEMSGLTRIAWDLGDVPASETRRTITLVYRASVRDTARDAATEIKAGEAIVNTASDYYDQTNKQSFNENAIPAPESFDRAGAPQNASATAVEPALTLVKEASVNGGAYGTGPLTLHAGDTVAYRLSVKNTGGSSAYAIAVVDHPPSALEAITPTTNAGYVKTNTPGEISWEAPGPLEPGETVVLGYGAKLVPAEQLSQGESADNHATVGSYYGIPTAERAEKLKNYAGEPIAYRKYAGPTAEVTGAVSLPTLQVTKTPAKATVATGENDSYTVSIHNAGPATAHEVLVEDTFPPGMTYTAGSASSKFSGFSELSASSSAAKWKIVAIEPGETAEITVPVGTEASVADKSKLTNTVAVTSGELPKAVQAQGTIETTTSAELIASKTVLSKAAVAGRPLLYEVSVYNKGPSVARSVVLKDKLPPGETFKSASVGCAEKVGVVECEAGDLGPAGEAKFQIEVVLASNVAAPIVNTVLAESPTPDPGTKNVAEAEVTPVKEAKLKLSKTALESEVIDGAEAKFSLVAVNEGPSDAEAVKLVDRLPAGLRYKRATTSVSGATCGEEPAASGEVVCSLGTLPSGETATVEVVTEATAPGSLLNTAQASSPNDPEQPTAEASVKVLPAASLSLEKTATPAAVELPGEVTYTLKVANSGPDAAQDVIVSDPLPAGVGYVSNDAGCKVSTSASGGELIACELGELASGVSRTIHLQTRFAVTLGERSIANTAEVTSTTADMNPQKASTATVRTGPTANLSLEKTGPASAVSGSQIAWTLEVVNHGPSSAHEVTVTDPLPTGVVYQSATTSQGSCTYQTGALTCALGALANGASAQVTLTATVTAGPGTVQNTASVSALEADPEPHDNTSTATTAIASPPDSGPAAGAVAPASDPAPAAGVAPSRTSGKPQTAVSLRKLVREREVAPTGRLDYRLIVQNTGVVPARAVLICDSLPVRATSVISRGGGRLANGRVCFSIALLAPGHRSTFRLVLRADAEAHGQIVNRASVTGANFPATHARAVTKVQRAGAGVAPKRESRVTG